MPERNRVQNCAALLQRGWLSFQPEPFRQRVIECVRLQAFDPGGTIYGLGDPPGGIYGLVRGTMGVSIAPGRAGPHLAHLALPGSWFGEGSFLTGQPRRVGLEAVTPCVLAHLTIADMERLVGGDPEVMRAFAQIAMTNIDLCMRGIEDLLIRDPIRRVAAVLWRTSGGQRGIEIPMTQAELARLANASRKYTLSALKQFVGLGLVRQGYHRIAVVEPERLRRFADDDGPGE
ncbi:MAG: Crp/Fnr family transcriptional regulator [Bauldia sp.]|nr:Crp/Fnr family transcriptional regulator [Bauldia sp.]